MTRSTRLWATDPPSRAAVPPQPADCLPELRELQADAVFGVIAGRGFGESGDTAEPVAVDAQDLAGQPRRFGDCSQATTAELRPGSKAGSSAAAPPKKSSLIRVTANGEIAFTATP